MLKIENDIQNYNNLNFKNKKFVGKRKLSLKQIMNYSSYNTHQHNAGNMTDKEFFLRTVDLIKKFLPVKHSLQWHINNKSKINYAKKTMFDILDTLDKLKSLNKEK